MHQEHIEDWMKHSSLLGQIDVDEQHWHAMKDLLAKKKKRRFIFWWFICAFLVIGICFLGYKKLDLSGAENKKKATKIEDTTSIKPSLNETEKKADSHINEKKSVDFTKKARLYATKPNNYKAKEKYRLFDKSSSSRTSKKVNKTTIEFDKFSIKKKLNTLLSHQKEKQKKESITKKEWINRAFKEQNIISNKSLVKEDSLINQVTKHLSTAKPVDSLLIIKDSTSISKTTDTAKITNPLVATKKQKSKWNFSVALSTRFGSSPTAFSLVSIQPTIHFNINKSLQLKTALGMGYGFNYNEQTFKNLVSFRQILGTTALRLDSLTVNFKPQNNLLFIPKLSIAYTHKKLMAEVGISFQKALTTQTNQLLVKGDTSFTQISPNQPRPTTTAFEANKYNGSQAWFVETNLGYMLLKNWELNLGLQFLLQTNKISSTLPISNNNLNVSLGIRKYFKRK